MMATALKETRSAERFCGVNLPDLKADFVLSVQTTLETYRLRIMDPAKGLVEVTGTDPRLSRPVLARLAGSVYGPQNSSLRMCYPVCIGFNLRMQLRFKNFLLTCDPTVALRVEGDGWHYDVF